MPEVGGMHPRALPDLEVGHQIKHSNDGSRVIVNVSPA